MTLGGVLPTMLPGIAFAWAIYCSASLPTLMARLSSVLSPRPPPHPLQDVSRAEYVVLSRDVHNALYNHHLHTRVD